METIKFKTNVKCGGCIEKITPGLNNLNGINKWSVDTTTPDKILTIQGENLKNSEIMATLEKVGYTATPLI